MNTIEASQDLATKLTKQQGERVNSLHHYYNVEHATEIVLNTSRTGPNAYANVYQRITDFVRATKVEKTYYDTLIDNFEIGVTVTFNELIQKVAAIRSDLDLPLYASSIKPLCENDLSKVFILERAYAPIEETPDRKSPKHIGYTPIVTLKPE